MASNPKATPPELVASKPSSPESIPSHRSTSTSPINLVKNLVKTFDKHIGEKKRRTGSNDTASLLSVYLRIRPSEVNTIEVLPCQQKIQTLAPDNSNAGKLSETVKEYNFQKVFGPEASQSDLFDGVARPVIQNVIDNNKSGILFAYGASNAGKTHTIFGSNDDEGLLPRALGLLLSSGCAIKLSYLEIYNEQLYDLLGKSSRLRLREDKGGKIYAEGLSKHTVSNLKGGLEMTETAMRKRHTTSNNINMTSSRSHTICQLELDTPTQQSLFLVDLAGAERSKRTNMRSVRLREANIINKSLSNLNKCFSQMQNQQHCVSFRESKLTHLFMNHFQSGGSDNTVMIVNVNPSPDDYDETQCVLGYASEAKNVKIPLPELKKRRNLISSNAPQNALSKRKRDDSSVESVSLPKKSFPTVPSNPAKVAKVLRKLSPRAARNRKMELENRRMGKVSTSSSISNSSTTNRTSTRMSSNRMFQQKEINDLKQRLKEKEEENEDLNSEILQMKEEMIERENEIRTEVANEMQARIKSIKEHYAKFSKPSYAVPTPSKSVQKLKAERTQQVINDLQDNVDECEEEMQRMRETHKEELERIHEETENKDKLYNDRLQLKEEEIDRLKELLENAREEIDVLKSQLGEVMDDDDNDDDVDNGSECSVDDVDEMKVTTFGNEDKENMENYAQENRIGVVDAKQ